MARIRSNYVFGTTTAALNTTDVTLASAELARLPVVVAPDVAAITLHNPTTGVYEIVYVTAHTAAATSATIVRAREGSTAASWASGSKWDHAETVTDVPLSFWADRDAPQTTLTGWTAEGGTWSNDGTVFHQTLNDTSTAPRLFLNGKQPTTAMLVEVEFKALTTASGRVGMVWSVPTATGGVGFYLSGAGSSLTSITFEDAGLANLGTLTLPNSVSVGAYHTMRVLKMGNGISIWIDGVMVNTYLFRFGAGNVIVESQWGLYTYNMQVDFKNPRAWLANLPV